MKLRRSKTPLFNPRSGFLHPDLSLVALSLISVSVCCQGQGTFQWTATFDGPPPIQPSDALAINYYYENGMTFRPIQTTGQFGRSGGGGGSGGWFAYNGTAYLVGAFTYSLSVTGLPARFGLVAVDLAEFSTLYQTPLTVQFVGYKLDGSMVTTEFVTDGIIDGTGPLVDFQTFYFDLRFADIVRVEVPTYGWSLDNMVFSNVIPEPSTGALAILGAVLGGFRFFKRKQGA